MKRKNFFILLELPFDPAANDIAQIKAAIHSKSQEWSRLQYVPEQKSIALENIELIPLIEEIMLDDAKREEEAKEAKEISSSMASSFEAELRILETKGFIYPKELKDLHSKYRSYGFDYELIRQLVKVSVTDTPPKNIFERTSVKALDREKGLLIQSHLEVLGLKDIYEFLKCGNDKSAKELFGVASAIKNNTFMTNESNGQRTATLLLADQALEVFETEESKASYDLFLKVNTYPELSTLIDDEFKRAGFISPEVLMRLVNFGITTYRKNVLELEEYVRSYCHAYDIDVNIASPQVVCPVCNHQSPRGTSFCPECASPLEGNCPICNKFFTDGEKICSGCGFAVGNMGLAIPHIEKAKKAFIENNWVEASNNIDYIEKYWPTNVDLLPLHNKLLSMKENHKKSVEQIENAVAEHKYYTAMKLLKESEKFNIVVPRDTAEVIRKTLSNFESQLKVLTDRETVNYDSISMLATQVSDSLELNQMLAKFPPEPPTKLTVVTKNRVVEVSWDKSPSSGLVSYILIRKKGGMPLTAYDGDILYEGEKNYFEDKTIVPLENYYYSVFSKRSGNYSNMGAVTVSQVRVIPEIEDFLATPGDGAAELSWLPPANIHRVIIWRKSGEIPPTSSGEGKLLDNTRIDSYVDINLNNEQQYWYYAVAQYKLDDGSFVESKGVVVDVEPHQSVDPIDQFFIIPTNEKNRYFLSWEGTNNSDIMFFYSRSLPSYTFGKMIRFEDILNNYEKIDLDVQIANNGRFELSFIGGMYIFPVVISGKFAAMGKVDFITNVPDVEEITYDIIGNDLFINFNWPSGSILSVTAAWREDGYPKEVSQKDTSSITMNREDYDYNAGIKIPDISIGKYYFKIYTSFVADDGKTVFSEGVDLLVDNTPPKEVFYDLDYKKAIFSDNAKVEVTVTSEHIVNLPRAVLVGKVGRVPLNITDGEPLFEIERNQDIAGSITFKYKCKKLPSNIYVRMFFFDENNYMKFRVIPTRSLKVTK